MACCYSSYLTWKHLAVVCFLCTLPAFSLQGKVDVVKKSQASKDTFLKCMCKSTSGCDPDSTQTCKEKGDLCMITKTPELVIAGCTKPNFCNMDDPDTTCCEEELCNAEALNVDTTKLSPTKATTTKKISHGFTTKYVLMTKFAQTLAVSPTLSDDKGQKTPKLLPSRVTQPPKWDFTMRDGEVPSTTSSVDKKCSSVFLTSIFAAVALFLAF